MAGSTGDSEHGTDRKWAQDRRWSGLGFEESGGGDVAFTLAGLSPWVAWADAEASGSFWGFV